ncbi:MAG: hypothetical protein Q4D92_05245 [Slackia sp.]|nr:hypothetical protein [Slackia sp.]
MKGKLKALTLCTVAALALFLLPAYAFATQQEGTVYSVGNATEFADATKKIAANAAEENAVIELTADVTLTDAFTGVEGKHVTVRSSGDGSTPPPFSDANF